MTKPILKMQFPVSIEMKGIIKKAAEASGKSMAQFIILACYEKAYTTLQNNKNFQLKLDKES